MEQCGFLLLSNVEGITWVGIGEKSFEQLFIKKRCKFTLLLLLLGYTLKILTLYLISQSPTSLSMRWIKIKRYEYKPYAKDKNGKFNKLV